MVTLTKAEERIMKILWDIEKGFINDIIDQYPNPKPPYNSVSTIVRVLVKKEIVGYTVFGNTHQYHPLVSKEVYRNGQLSHLISDYYDGSFSQVVNFFSENRRLNDKELDEAMKILNELRSQKNG